MVPVHSAHPQADGRARPGHFSYGSRLELLVVYVRLQHFDHRIRDIVLKCKNKYVLVFKKRSRYPYRQVQKLHKDQTDGLDRLIESY